MSKRSKTAIGIAVAVFALLYIAGAVFIVHKQNDSNIVIETEAEEFVIDRSAEQMTIPLHISNYSNAVLNSSIDRYYISYHVKSEEGDMISYDNIRTEFPKWIYPRKSMDVPAVIDEIESGTYIFEFDIVREGMSWLSDKGMQVKEVKVTVK